MTEKKSILFLGGGELGVPAIEWAKKIGFTVIVNDKKSDTPGKKIADIGISYDSADVRAIATWVLKNPNLNICYCHCNSDFGLITANLVQTILGLPCSSLEAIICGLDKGLMKKRWSDAKLDFPISFTVNSFEDALSSARQLGWPIIIKPTSASGSQGVGLVENEEELKRLFDAAMTFSSDKQLLIEKFLRGTHHDVNGFFWLDKFYSAGIGDRCFTKLPNFVPHHGYFPSLLNSDKISSLYELLEKGARALGITHGPVKADCVICNDICYVYEISARFHGDIFTVRTMQFLNEMNPLYGFFRFIYDNGDSRGYQLPRINKVGGWKTVFNLEEIEKFKQNSNSGLFLKNYRASYVMPRNNDEIIGLCWVTADNRQEIDKLLITDDQYEQV